MQFTAFVDRVRDALAHAMPTARVEVEVAEPRLVRPDTKVEPQPPAARNYDPYDHYYYSPTYAMADIFLWSAMFSMMSPPHYVVVDGGNHYQGHTDDSGIQDGPTDTAPDTADADAGSWWDDTSGDTSAAADPDAGGDSGGSWWDDAGGGDGGGFDGGDFGGFD